MKKILYIDDNQINLDIFSEQFSHIFNVVVSTSPNNMFELLEQTKFDAILLDIHMPERNGFEVLKDIMNSAYAKIPVFFYTTDELQVLRYQALESLASDILYRTLPEKEIELRILNKINLSTKQEVVEKHLNLFSLKLNTETMEAFCNEVNLNLTLIEFKILASLMRCFPDPLPKDVMINKAWSVDTVQDRTVNTHLTNLRNKLPRDEFSLESLRGNGIVLKRKGPLNQ